LLPYLKRVVEDRDDSKFHPFGEKPTPAVENAATLVPASTIVDWPALFEPRLLACGTNGLSAGKHMAVALSRHGRGMVITSVEESTETAPFVLEGTALLGPFLGAHLDDTGLLLTTATGSLVECPGAASSGRWACRAVSMQKLPLGLSTEPFGGAISVARRSSAELLSAVVFPGEQSVTIFRRAGEAWLPAGASRTPSQVVATAFADNAESLLMLMTDGAVVKLRLADGAMAMTAEAVQGPAHTWQATCSLHNDQVARLGIRPSGSSSWEPSLIFGA
jgi:hypothetical protein